MTTEAVRLRERAEASGRTPSRWWGFLIRRLGKILISMFVVLAVAFAVLRFSGTDPVRAALGPTADEALVQARRAQLGLDLPVWEQFINYIGGIFHGDIGISLVNGRAVSDIVATRLPATLQLAAVAFAIVLLVAVPLGLTAAIIAERRRKRTDAPVFTLVTGFFAAVPEYLLAVGLVLVFAITLRWFPIAGSDSVLSYVLPATAMSVASAASLARIARVEALAVLQEDYVRTARSKRLPSTVVYFRHALPNMLSSTLTLGGILLGAMITSGVLVEKVFNWPGMGAMFVDAIAARDYGIVQGLALIYAVILLLLLLVVDIVLAVLDPRSTITETT